MNMINLAWVPSACSYIIYTMTPKNHSKINENPCHFFTFFKKVDPTLVYQCEKHQFLVSPLMLFTLLRKVCHRRVWRRRAAKPTISNTKRYVLEHKSWKTNDLTLCRLCFCTLSIYYWFFQWKCKFQQHVRKRIYIYAKRSNFHPFFIKINEFWWHL